MNPNNALAGLDLKEKEIVVYKALLELGEVPVTRVTKRAGLKRPTTYAVLKSLEGKGFVSRTIRGKKMLFAAQHPKKLVTEAEIRLRELQAAVPQLESMMGNLEQRPRVVVYEGKDALDKAYDDSFVTKGEVLYMGQSLLKMKGAELRRARLPRSASSPGGGRSRTCRRGPLLPAARRRPFQGRRRPAAQRPTRLNL